MRPVRLKAVNFLSHAETEVKLKGIDSVVVLGMNGSGKSSFMIDCFLVSVFGRGRSGDLDGYIRNGKSMLTAEADVLAGGKYYRTIRKRSKKASRGETILEFYHIDDLGNVVNNLTQGTIVDTQSLILKTMGTDFDTVVRTNILEQGEADYFCKATPTERMELFSKVWDLEKYDEMAQIERDEISALRERIKTLDEKRDVCLNKMEGIEKEKVELESLKKTSAALGDVVDRFEKKKEKTEKSLARYESFSNELKKAEQGILKVADDMRKLADQYTALLARIDRYTKIIKNKQAVMDHVEMQKDREKKIEALQLLRKSAETAAEQVQGQIRTIEQGGRAKVNEIQRRRTGYQKSLDEVVSKIAKEKNRLILVGKYEEQLSFLEKDASKLGGIKCHPDFDPSYVNEACRFIKDAADAKTKIPGLKKQIAAENKVIAAAVAALEEEAGKFRTSIAELHEEDLALQRKLHEQTASLEERVKRYRSEIEQYDREIDEHEKALVQIKKFTVLVSEVALAEKELPALTDEAKKHDQTNKAWLAEKERLLNEKKKIESQLTGRTELEQELQSVCKELNKAREQKENATKRLGFLEGEVARMEELNEEVKRINAEVETLMSEKATKQLTEEALRAIPFLMVSRGVGVVENIANGILAEVSTRGLRVHIETEKMTKTTKRVRDELHLAIQDQDGPKGYKFLSGGEQLRVAFALRLAISEALAHRRGVRIDCLLADEPFGPLDTEGVDDMKVALRELRKRFGLMAVITHHEKAQDIFPVRLEFKYSNGQSQVEVVDDFQ